MWFGPELFGQEVTFIEPNPSTWVLEEMISEHAACYDEVDCKDMSIIPEARAVFLCSKRDGDGPEEALIKIYMQFVILLPKDHALQLIHINLILLTSHTPLTC